MDCSLHNVLRQGSGHGPASAATNLSNQVTTYPSESAPEPSRWVPKGKMHHLAGAKHFPTGERRSMKFPLGLKWSQKIARSITALCKTILDSDRLCNCGTELIAPSRRGRGRGANPIWVLRRNSPTFTHEEVGSEVTGKCPPCSAPKLQDQKQAWSNGKGQSSWAIPNALRSTLCAPPRNLSRQFEKMEREISNPAFCWKFWGVGHGFSNQLHKTQRLLPSSVSSPCF